jgi:hypothetical protein
MASQEPLRQWRLPRADSKNDPVRSRKLLRDLETRVTSANDEHSSLRDVAGVAVARGVQLRDIRPETVGNLRHERLLEGAGGDDDLVGPDRLPVDLEGEPAVLGCQPPDRAVQLDRELERLRVALQVGDHLVTDGIALRIAGKRQAWKAAVAARREQRQRIPAVAPSGTDRIGRVHDHEPSTLLLEEVPDRESGLTRSNHHDLLIGDDLWCRVWFALGRSHLKAPFRLARSETRRNESGPTGRCRHRRARTLVKRLATSSS